MIKRIIDYLTRTWMIKSDPIRYARSLGVRIGKDCRFLGITPGTFGSEPYLIRIGDHVTVTSGVCFITHDGGVWVFRERHPDIDVVAPIIVGNNVFIGINAIMMPGSKIGDNCVIGAGAVVTGEIPSNTVAVGVPAKPIKSINEYWEDIQKKATWMRSQSSEKRRGAYIAEFETILFNEDTTNHT